MSSSMYGATGYGAGNVKDKKPKGYNKYQLEQYTPEQQQLFSQSFSHVGPDSYLSRLARGDEGLYEEMEAPAKRQFSGQLGNLASRFSGMGTGGRRSSGFQNTATAASSNFAQDLQSKRQGLQRQAIQDLRGFSMDLLNQRPFEKGLVEKQPEWWETGLKFGGDLINSAVGGYAQGYAGRPA